MSDMTIQNAIYCMKAILCEEVCERCDYYGKTGTDHCESDAVRMAIKALEEQSERGKGHWIQSDTDGFVCSVCNNGYKNQPTIMGKPMFEFCPVCGARMGGEVDD